jgi:hypothetical protein
MAGLNILHEHHNLNDQHVTNMDSGSPIRRPPP